VKVRGGEVRGSNDGITRQTRHFWETTHENESLLCVCWPTGRQFAHDRCRWVEGTGLDNLMPQRTDLVGSVQPAKHVDCMCAALERTAYNDALGPVPVRT